MTLFAQMNGDIPDPAILQLGSRENCLFGFLLIAKICLCWTLCQLLAKCRPRNCMIKPAVVWLILIPCFDWFLQVVTVQAISETLKNEFNERRPHLKDSSFTTVIGLVWAVSYIVMFLWPTNWVVISNLFCFITYFVKIWQIKNELQTGDIFQCHSMYHVASDEPAKEN